LIISWAGVTRNLVSWTPVIMVAEQFSAVPGSVATVVAGWSRSPECRTLP